MTAEPPLHADVCVVGAGLVGLYNALQYARRGFSVVRWLVASSGGGRVKLPRDRRVTPARTQGEEDVGG